MIPWPNFSAAVPVIGWTLAHFVWQALAIYLIFLFLNFLARRASAQIRYALGCLAMLALVASAVVTAGITARRGDPDVTRIERTVEDGRPVTTITRSPNFISDTRGWVRLPHPGKPTLYDRTVSAVAPWLPHAVMGWTVGLLLITLYQARGLLGVRQLVLSGQPLAEASRYEALAKRLGIRRTVRFLQTAALSSPATVGWLKPIVLLPMALTSDFTIAEIDAFVAHELAHVRRYDYLVNLAQMCVETLFFFHPCVWLISRSMRNERELCCDAVATRMLAGTTSLYARALVRLSDMLAIPSLAIGARGGSLLQRVMFLAKPGRNRPLDLSSILMTLLISLGMGSFAVAAVTQRAAVLRDHALIATIPENVFVFDLLNGRGDNPDFRRLLINALAIADWKGDGSNPNLAALVESLNTLGCDPELVWNEYQVWPGSPKRTEDSFHPLFRQDYPADWPFRMAGDQSILASELWDYAKRLHDPKEAARYTRAAMLIGAMHRESTSISAMRKIVFSPMFDAASGFPGELVDRLRTYLSLRWESQKITLPIGQYRAFMQAQQDSISATLAESNRNAAARRGKQR